MGHVCLDKVASGKGAAQAELPSQNASSHNTGKFPGVVTGIGGVSAPDAKEVEHSALRLEDGPASNRADFNRGHGDTNLEIIVVARRISKTSAEKKDRRTSASP